MLLNDLHKGWDHGEKGRCQMNYLNNKELNKMQKAMFIQILLYPFLIEQSHKLLPQEGPIIQLMIPQTVYVVEVKISIQRHVDWLHFHPFHPLDFLDKSPVNLLGRLNHSFSLGRRQNRVARSFSFPPECRGR